MRPALPREAAASGGTGTPIEEYSHGFQRVSALRLLAAVALLGVFVVLPASAYVVVTSDNQLYEVPTKPVVRGDLVLFTVDGVPVSLRVYQVNLRRTNELNYKLDQGATSDVLARAIRSLGDSAEIDERIIISSRLQRVPQGKLGKDSPSYRFVRGELPESPSFADSPGRQEWDAEDPRSGRSIAPLEYRSSFGDAPGGRRASSPAASRSSSRSRSRSRAADEDSGFRDEARRALEDAERRMEQPRYEPPRDDVREHSAMANAPMSSAPSAADMRRQGRIAELEEEIAAEQAYLRQLTAGEVVVDDLDRELSRSMDKVTRLQERRASLVADLGMRPSEVPARDAYEHAGTESYPPGSREAKWQSQLREARSRLERLEHQLAILPPGESQERELTNELIGETTYQIQRLENKLGREY